MKRFRAKVKNDLYPILKKESESIEDAKTMLQVLSMTVRQAMMHKQKGLKVSDLEIPAVDKAFKRFETVLAIFKEETVSDTMEILDGMNLAIDGFIKEENSKRPLSDLKETLLD